MKKCRIIIALVIGLFTSCSRREDIDMLPVWEVTQTSIITHTPTGYINDTTYTMNHLFVGSIEKVEAMVKNGTWTETSERKIGGVVITTLIIRKLENQNINHIKRS